MGPAETIEQARHLRKMLGGTQRQIGVLAATGLEAVEVMSARLHEDHAMAAQLYTGLRAVLPQSIGLTVPASNILFVELPEAAAHSTAWAEVLEAHGVLIRPWGSRRIRLVTHRHIDANGVEKAVQGFKAAVTQLHAD